MPLLNGFILRWKRQRLSRNYQIFNEKLPGNSIIHLRHSAFILLIFISKIVNCKPHRKGCSQIITYMTSPPIHFGKKRFFLHRYCYRSVCSRSVDRKTALKLNYLTILKQVRLYAVVEKWLWSKPEQQNKRHSVQWSCSSVELVAHKEKVSPRIP